MNLNWTNQLREIRKLLFRPLLRVGLANFSVVAPLAPLVIGGFLVFIPESVQARPSCGSCVIAQVEEVYEEVPPNSQIETDSSQQAQFTPYGYYSQNYLLYVPTYSTELVNFVRRLVPEAGEVADEDVRRYRRGRNGFAVGIYNFAGAQRRASRLMREGITVEMIPLNGGVSGSVAQSARYVVYVRARNTSEARELLSFIREIVQPDASRVGRRIKVGEFNNSTEANSAIRLLQEDLGIPRNRISIENNRQAPRRYFSNENEPRLASSEDNENEPRLASSDNNDNNDKYMVVIPANEGEFPIVQAQVRQMGSTLGTNPEVYQAEDSNGRYIVVGPFEERITAEQMERYLQDSGMTNARLSIER